MKISDSKGAFIQYIHHRLNRDPSIETVHNTSSRIHKIIVEIKFQYFKRIDGKIREASGKPFDKIYTYHFSAPRDGLRSLKKLAEEVLSEKSAQKCRKYPFSSYKDFQVEVISLAHSEHFERDLTFSRMIEPSITKFEKSRFRKKKTILNRISPPVSVEEMGDRSVELIYRLVTQDVSYFPKQKDRRKFLEARKSAARLFSSHYPKKEEALFLIVERVIQKVIERCPFTDQKPLLAIQRFVLRVDYTPEKDERTKSKFILISRSA